MPSKVSSITFVTYLSKKVSYGRILFFLLFAGGRLFDVRVSKIRSRETRACPSKHKGTLPRFWARSLETRAGDPASRPGDPRALASPHTH